jgi:S-formylglutathione hydrolase FrmB
MASERIIGDILRGHKETPMAHRYRVVVERFHSKLLEGNRLGDPAERDLHVVVPEEIDAGRKLPVVWCLTGYSGVGKMLLRDDPWEEGLRERVERLSRAGSLGPSIYVLPDCFTRYGGSQYLNSTATGSYEDYLWKELFPWVTSHFPCGRHGVIGKSSGGYGAMVQGMRHPEIISAIACHSGDSAFEYCYLPDFPKFLDGIAGKGGLDAFVAAFDRALKKRDGKWLTVMNIIAMAANYSPNPDSATLGIDFPFDLKTGEIREAVWKRWLSWDPLRMMEAHAAALKGMRLLFLDCGTKDEFHLQYGARMMDRKLQALGIRHVYEEFEDGHMGISYRYERSLPLMWEALRDA